MSTQHENERPTRLGRGELRRPGDYSDQPGQGTRAMPRDMPRDENIERDTHAGAGEAASPAPVPRPRDV